MSWTAKNIGEFNSSFLSTTTWECDEWKRERLNLYEGIFVSENYFNFHAPNGRFDCILQWLPKTRKLISRVIITDLETEEQYIYSGNEELSQPEPSKYMWYLFQRCFEIIHDSRMLGTTASIDGGYIIPTDEEMDEIEKELGLKALSEEYEIIYDFI